MHSIQVILDQTFAIRQRVLAIADSIPADQGDRIPPRWNNNLRWHLGHLVTTPRLLTFGLCRESMDLPEEYRAWFSKGTAPKDWPADGVPPLRQLCDELIPTAEKMFRLFEARWDTPFPEPYMTSAGVALHTPGESLNFSLAHDGIHLGLLLALKRDLAG